MRSVLDIAFAAVLAVILGAGTALFILDRRSEEGSIRVGAWAAEARPGQISRDPYDAAAAAIRVNLPLGAAEGLEFTATRDDTGALLVARCDYWIDGAVLPARLWTIALEDDRGLPFSGISGRTGFHSREILRAQDASFRIELSSSVKPGNWLPSSGSGEVRLVLRLYDTPLTSGLVPLSLALPTITRGTCR